MIKLRMFILFGIVFYPWPAIGQDTDLCRVVLDSNAFNTLDESVTNRVAFEKKEDICRRNYSSSEEFRNAARQGGFNLSYAGFGIGASGGKSSGSGNVHFREESFCQASQDEFAQEYSRNTRVQVTDVAVSAWRDCVSNTKRNSLWLQYKVEADGTGMTGTIYRTISSGPTPLKITAMQVQPNNLAEDVTCTIENATVNSKFFESGQSISTDSTREVVECTKPSDKSVRVAFGTDGDSLTWVEMPSIEEREKDRVDEFRNEMRSLQGVINSLKVRLDEQDRLLDCPDPSSIEKYGFCIWHVPGYDKNFAQAATACVTEGARLCSRAEVSNAQALGAQWCSHGWTSDRSSALSAWISYPMQSDTRAPCGSAFLVQSEQPIDSLFGANCCK